MANNNYIVYRYRNKINNKSYIGQTRQKTSVRSKFNGSGYKDSPKFWKAIQKYGWEQFELTILKANCSAEEADLYEQQYIIQFDSIKNGYNIDGGGQINHIVSKETVQKRNVTRKKNAPNRPKYHLPDELKIRQASSRKNSSAYWDGRKRAGLKLKGVPRSIQVRQKISQKHKASGHRPGEIAILHSITKNSKTVIQYNKKTHEYIQTFVSISEAVRVLFPQLKDKKQLDSKASVISAVCKNKKPSAYGFYWRFKE